jgi:dTDP-4-amino-4,6-dideoxygalactose transaminase
MIYNGLSARMSELHAAVGLLSLRNADALIAARMKRIARYRHFAESLPGCRVQEFPDDRTSSGNYFTLMIGKTARRTRDEVYDALKAQGIQSKKYFYPPVHVQPAFSDRPRRIVGDLPHTWEATQTSLALPLFAHMTDEQQQRVIQALERLLG